MQQESVKTFTAEICIAGNAEVAKQFCREYAMKHSVCVTVTPTDYVYVGGAEPGVIVRLINYPRFPSTQDDIFIMAMDLAGQLRIALCQLSFTIITPETTIWRSYRNETTAARG
jgi:hypothetical protein